MSEHSHRKNQSDNTSDTNKVAFNSRPWIFLLMAGWAVLILTAILHPYMNERVKFITEMGMGFTVVVAVIAQIEVSRRQWQVMREAIHRQDADLRQWIEIQPVGIMTDSRSESEPPKEVNITLRWKVVNATRLPFAIERIDISICRHKTWEIFEIVDSETIPPAGQDARNSYPFFVPLELTKEQTECFLGDGIGLSIAMVITWIDAIGETREQRFGDLYECGIDYMRVIQALGKSPTFIGTEEGKATIVTSDVNRLADFTIETRRNPN